MKNKFSLIVAIAILSFIFNSCSSKENNPQKVGRILYHETIGDFYFLSVTNPKKTAYDSDDKSYMIYQYTYDYGDFSYSITYFHINKKQEFIQIIQDELKRESVKFNEMKSISFKEIEGIEVSDQISFRKRIYATSNHCYVLSVNFKYYTYTNVLDDPNINAFLNSFYLSDNKVNLLKNENSNIINDSTKTSSKTKEESAVDSLISIKNKNIISGQRIDEGYSKVRNDLIESGQDITEDTENNLKYIATGGYGEDGSFALYRYNFNKYDICENVQFATNSFELINNLLDLYNKNYKVIKNDNGFQKTWVDQYGFYVSYKEELVKDIKHYYILMYKAED